LICRPEFASTVTGLVRERIGSRIEDEEARVWR
jgi:hypothetical protein